MVWTPLPPSKYSWYSHLLCIYCKYIAYILCICCTFIVNILYIYSTYIVHIFYIYCASSPLPILLPSLYLIAICYQHILLNLMHTVAHISIVSKYFSLYLVTDRQTDRPNQFHIKALDPNRVDILCDVVTVCAIRPFGESKIINFLHQKIISPRYLKCQG